jgi:hypothetical protein
VNAVDCKEIVAKADARVVEVLELTSRSVLDVLISFLLTDRQLASGSVESLPGGFASALVAIGEGHLQLALSVLFGPPTGKACGKKGRQDQSCNELNVHHLFDALCCGNL